MNCSSDLIEAYMDGELDPASKAAVEEHLSSCQACLEAHARFRKQSASIRAAAPYYPAPAHLQQGGILQIVVQRRVPLDRLLSQHFATVTTPAENGRYRVWRAAI